MKDFHEIPTTIDHQLMKNIKKGKQFIFDLHFCKLGLKDSKF